MRPSTQWNHSGSKGAGHIEIFLLSLSPPTKKKRHNDWWICFWCWRQHIYHLGLLFWPIYWMIWKAARFEWDFATGPSCPASCSYDRAEPVVLEVSVAGREAVRRLYQFPEVNCGTRHEDFRATPCHPLDNYSPFEKWLLPCHWVFIVETTHLTMGHGYDAT